MFLVNVLPTSEKYLQNAFAISFGFFYNISVDTKFIVY